MAYSTDLGRIVSEVLGLCWTKYRDQAQLWDDALDGGKKNAKGESPEARKKRLEKARDICEQCPLYITCEYAVTGSYE